MLTIYWSVVMPDRRIRAEQVMQIDDDGGDIEATYISLRDQLIAQHPRVRLVCLEIHGHTARHYAHENPHGWYMLVETPGRVERFRERGLDPDTWLRHYGVKAN